MSRTRRREVRIRVVGDRRKEPDVRRIAKAIIRMSLDGDDTADQLGELEHRQRQLTRRRKSPAEGDQKGAA